jgi:serine/threonine-protein kinase
MSTVSTDRFLEMVRKSKLVDDERLDQFLASLAPEILHGEDPAAISHKLVAAELLTQWQADRILKDGKYRGYFLGDGKYKLLGHIGTGGMSNVYLAEHTRMQRRVAIKLLPRSRIDDSSYLARFYLEAQAAAKLHHPNIVGAYDIEEEKEGRNYYIVLEYVEGQDLQALVNGNGPLAYAVAADYVAQSANGLAAAHRAALIHRDIKPSNLLVDRYGTVKVLDLGLAKFSESEEASLTVAYDETVLGTADYLSPEQARDSHSVDPRTDIYSLGCTLYFLLTGHPPFPKGSIPQRLLKHQTEMPASIFVDRPDAPADLVAICERMMAKQADQRYQNANEVAEALRNWLSTQNVVGTYAPPIPNAPPLSPPGPAAETLSGIDPDTKKESRTRQSPGDSISGLGPQSGIEGRSTKKLKVAKAIEAPPKQEKKRDDPELRSSFADDVLAAAVRGEGPTQSGMGFHGAPLKLGQPDKSDIPVAVWWIAGVSAVVVLGLVVAALILMR